MSSRGVSERARALTAETLRVRGYAVEEDTEGRRTVLRVVGRDRTHTVRVSARQTGDWQTSIEYGYREATDDVGRIWAFVDLSVEPPTVGFALEAAVERDIWRTHNDYLQANAGRRAHSPDSKHHRITTDRKDRLCRLDPLAATTPAKASVVTYGLDLSTAAISTGLVSVDWPAIGLGFVRCHGKEERGLPAIAGLIEGTVKAGSWWAVDVPFGWPEQWASYLIAHRDGPATLPAAPDRQPAWYGVARLVTDREVIGRQPDGQAGVSGFSVTFDKLGATAAAWAHVESLLHPGLTIDRTGTSGQIIETYPAAAWQRWRLAGSPAKMTWPEMAEALAGVVLVDEEAAVGLAASPHHRDALVCALVARARQLDPDHGTAGPAPHQIEVARREGWIHLPPFGAPLTMLAGVDNTARR